MPKSPLTRPRGVLNNYRLRPLSSLIARRLQLLPIAKGGGNAPPRGGFTLVEMLVAVAVVVVMMTLFTTIFQVATNGMQKSKGISENDQRVRLVVTMLRNDLSSSPTDRVTGNQTRQHRTFRVLIPYAAGEPTANPPVNPETLIAAAPEDRSGYFYISEGDPFDDTDDNIQLTVVVPSASNERIYGRAAGLFPDSAGNYGDQTATPPVGTPPALPALAPPGNWWFNQPEFDDLLGTPNQAGSSTTAEVSYFLRNGTLYRRVMLVRQPNVTVTPANNPTPTDNASPAAGALSLAAYTGGAISLWRDFDYSVFYGVAGTTFHGFDDLQNNNVASTLLSPATRWGFDATSAAGSGLGRPREYDSSNNYIGRFTHRETSDANFGYPATIPGGLGGNPMAASTTLTLSNGVVTSTAVASFPSGSRVGEDVLMSNVIAFDIKVWDPAASLGPDGQPGIGFDTLGNPYDDDHINGANDNGEIGAYGSDDGDWRDIGHPGLKIGTNYYGFYRKPLDASGNPNAAALPNQYYSNPFGTPPTNRYDTWGPGIDSDGTAGNDLPPFQPIYAGPDGKPGKANYDDDNANGIDDAGELGATGSDDFAPLTAIKITIRFYDVTSNQVRDITGVYPLVYEP